MGDVPAQDPNNQPIPPWGQPPYGQPQQPPYGQNSYGQQYAPQPPAGMNQFGMNQFGMNQPGANQHTNGLAIISLVSVFFFSIGSIVGIITGHIALSQIKRTGEKGRKLAISGLIIGYFSILAMVVFVVVALVSFAFSATSGSLTTSSSQSQGTRVVPANSNSFGGITFGADGVLVPPASTAPVDLAQHPAITGSNPDSAINLDKIGIAPSASTDPVQVVVYLDFMCPYCEAFETEHGSELKSLADAGKITIEYRPIAYLDRLSSGTNYSSRAAAAASCVGAVAPARYQEFVIALYAAQPKENSEGLDDATLVKIGKSAAGADVADCVSSQKYRPYVADTTTLAVNHAVNGTPTMFADGQQWQSGTFADFMNTVLGANSQPLA